MRARDLPNQGLGRQQAQGPCKSLVDTSPCRRHARIRSSWASLLR